MKITKKNMTWGSASNLGTDYWAYIQNSNTGLGLTADSNGNVCGRKLTKADNQLWYLERLNDGTYRLHSKSTGKILTLYNSNYFNSGNIDAEPYTDNNNSKWRVYASGNGYVIHSALGDSGVLDLNNAYTAVEGANAQIYTYNGGVT